MLPGYRYMDPYPHLHSHNGNHLYYPHHQYPTWEVVPPHMKEEPVKSPPGCEPWCGYPNQTGYHACCNNMHPPGCYSMRPPHPHLPPPTPFYYHGPYPTVPEVHPAYYGYPPHYSVEQPRYEYDKNMHGNYFCGCPHNACNQKEAKENNKGVKIEEHEAETEQKDSDASGPVILKNNHPLYPFVWIPPGYMKSKDKSAELEPKGPNGLFPFEMKTGTESGKPSERRDLNDSFPVNLKSINSLNSSGNETNNENHHIEGKVQHPFPMIWFPAYDKSKDAQHKEQKEHSTNPLKELPAKLKIIPVNSSDDNQADKSKVLEDASSFGVVSKAVEKVVKPENATSKQVRVNVLNKSPQETERTVKTISVQPPQESGKDLSDKTARKRSPSPPNSSKLPPVCLRVDPLPRRKNGNTSSRSPSPPGKEVDQISDGILNVPRVQAVENQIGEDSNNKDTFPNKNGEVQTEKGIRIVHVEDGKTEHDKEEPTYSNVQVNSPLILQEELSNRGTTENGENCGGVKRIEGGNQSVEAMVTKPGDESIQKEELSTESAAIRIQSAYRGFEVRRLDLLKKLRKISRVREQVQDVSKRIHTLDGSLEMQKDEKQRVVIGEMIMSLLLQLDTIQGLDPNVRDIRKSVARELMCLQDKLDSFPVPKADLPEEAKITRPEVGEHYPVDKELKEHTLENSTQSAGEIGSNVGGQPTSASVDLQDGENNQDPIFEESHKPFEKVNSVLEYTEESKMAPKEVIDMPRYEDETTNATVVTQSLEKSREAQLHEKADSEMEGLGVVPNNEGKVCILVSEGTCPVDKTMDLPIAAKSPESESDASLPAELPLQVVDGLSPTPKSCSQDNSDPDLGKDEGSEPKDLFVVPSVAEEGMSMEAPLQMTDLALGGGEVLEKSSIADVGTFKSDGATTEFQGGLEVTAEQREKIQKTSIQAEMEQSGAKHVDEEIEDSVVAYENNNVDNSSILEKTHVDSLSGEYSAKGLREDMEVPTKENTGDTTTPEETNPPDAVEVAENIKEMKAPIGEKKHLKNSSVPKDALEANDDGLADKTTDKFCYDSLHLEVYPVKLENKEAEIDAGEVVGGETLELRPGAEKPADVASTEDGNPADVASPEDIVRRDIQKAELGRTKDNVLAEENEKLREMVEKLVQAGNQQLLLISDLNGRVKDLERKLVKKKKLKMRRPKVPTEGSPRS